MAERDFFFVWYALQHVDARGGGEGRRDGR